ncbi:protein KTI12 homolog [Sitodiplosis mosellana]|uniref:protein KTI12 homolog n=1 Tax=Sitodiplosis mosellana TaxID=263140 RepID=UPI0024441BB5|nr:protein KTI12 homolog [Sitodiplosis mosellana]
MPLIILTGFPSSGKTKRSKELADFFRERGKMVHIVSENLSIPKAGFAKNVYFADSQKEKIVRSDLKSETVRLLTKDNVVILDAANYIKGYRYELYCASKAARSTQCTVFCAIPKETAWNLNQKRSGADVVESSESDNSSIPYTREIFDALTLRYEEPIANNRWDSPLFTLLPESKIPFEDVFSALYEKKPPPPNLATQNAPMTSTNYLYEMDKLTQEITNTVISARKIGVMGPVQIRDNLHVKIPATVNASQLNKLRRQFLNYNKMHSAGGHNLDKAPDLFVQFLNANF